MRVLITGATGLLGGYLVAEAERRKMDVRAWAGTRDVDLRDARAVERGVGDADADAVIHAAAMALVGDCARDPDKAHAVNVTGTANVVAACKGRRLVHVSTDLVFDGETAPYREGAPVNPLSVYGQTKVRAEREVEAHSNALVARVSLLYGPTRTKRVGFFDTQVEALRDGKPITLFDDEWRTPLSLRAAAEALLAIAESSVTGILHVAGPERMSRLEMGQRIAKALGLSSASLEARSRLSIPGEPRARDVSLDPSLFCRTFPGLATRTLEEELRDPGLFEH